MFVAWLCLWVVGCGALALNESWHQQWHQLAGDPPASESGCAIDLFASGGVAPGLDFVAIVATSPDAVEVAWSAAEPRHAQRVVSEAWRTRGPPVEG